MFQWVGIDIKTYLLWEVSGASALWGSVECIGALLAQGEGILPSSPSGWAGWASFLSSGGVLAWLLLKHLPEKDKQMERMVDSRDVMVKNVTDIFSENLRHVREEFKASLEAFRAEQRETRHDNRDSLNVILLQQEKRYHELIAALKIEFEQIVKKLEERSP